MHYYDLAASGNAREPKGAKLSLFLEPRSLVITAQEQYTEYAHGIDAVSEDRMARGDLELANAGMLGNGGGSGASSLLAEGGVQSRQTRYSLTCRDVARVMNVSIGMRK
jgi:alkylated DNA repair protein alkB family protein 6